MKNGKLFRGATRSCLFAAALLVAGCGDDGAQGPAGPAGPGGAGVPVTSTASALTVNVDSVTIASPPVVELTVTNELGVRYVGLAAPSFTLAKLVPGSNGGPSAWQSYINRVEAADSNGPGTEDTIQATTDSGGTWTSNGDGTYTYTFGKDITNITTPLAVSYQPTLTHRLGIQIRAGATYPASNPVYDFRPSDGATTGLTERDIVQTASCNECHSKLAVHGGSRIEMQYCVTCHNPGTTDANSGNTVDFKVMIHKIHRGHDLPSVVAGGEYAIWGFNDTKHDYSELGYPQDIRNCTKCHDAADAATPQANNWQDVPSMEACGSCHDDVVFADGTNHGPGGFGATNADCTFCHAQGKIAGTVASSHAIPAKIEGAKYAFSFVSVTSGGVGEFPVITYKITDPTNGDAAYDVRAAGTDPEFTSSTASLTILLSWSTTDYDNIGNGSTTVPASALALNGRTSGANNSAPVDNGDGTYTITSTKAIPATASGSGTVAFYGRAAGDFDANGTFTDQVPIKGAVKAFAITDTTAVARRDVVDGDKCDACHDRLILHGQRLAEPQMCAVCHNADNTDVSRRGGVAGVDGKFEETVDFKVMIHAIHGAAFRQDPITIYGFGNSVHTFDTSVVHYPGILNNCAACHAGEDEDATFLVPLKPEVMATTIDSNVIADHADDVNVTPTAAVCSSCHDNDAAVTHMEQNGASFVMVGDPGSYNETCSVCHGPGRLADVAEVHAIAP